MLCVNTVATKWFITIIIYLSFIYQFIDLTLDYTKYDHVNKIVVESTFGVFPSTTICLKQESNSVNKLINETIMCFLFEKGKYYKDEKSCT